MSSKKRPLDSDQPTEVSSKKRSRTHSDQPIDQNFLAQWSLSWKTIPIQDTGESLVPIGGRLLVSSEYHNQGISGALPEIYVRQTVLDKLLLAQQYLQETHPGCRLKVLDGWRPVAVQQALFDDYKAKLRADVSAWTSPEEKQLFDLGNRRTDVDQAEFDRLATIKTQNFVSLPSENPECPSPHLTGGSVDVTIVDANKKELDMGTEFDDFSAQAHTHYFEEHDSHIRDNRRLLFSVMTRAGFTNFPYEWWHFDFANQFYVFRSRLADPSSPIRIASYGPVLSPPTNA
jgi:D-alanyl-D-alanine dipeptidase